MDTKGISVMELEHHLDDASKQALEAVRKRAKPVAASTPEAAQPRKSAAPVSRPKAPLVPPRAWTFSTSAEYLKHPLGETNPNARDNAYHYLLSTLVDPEVSTALKKRVYPLLRAACDRNDIRPEVKRRIIRLDKECI